MSTTATERRTYTLAEACDLLGISRRNADRLLADTGRIHPDVHCVRIGSRWLVSKAELLALLGEA